MIKLLIIILGTLWLCGPRYYWSKFVRVCFESKYKKNVILPKVNTLFDIQQELTKISWTQDNIWKLFDVISYPETVYATKHDDCDGFATLVIHLLKQLNIKGYYYTYIPRNWKQAHTICVFRYKSFIYAFDNSYLTPSKITDWNQYKSTVIPKFIIDDLRDINFKKVNTI